MDALFDLHVFVIKMGGNCCSNTEKEPDLPLPEREPPLESKTLYMSTIEAILSISNNRLDGTFIPLTGRNSLIMPLGAELDPKRFVRFFLIFTFYINKYSPEKPPTNKEVRDQYEANFYKLVKRTHAGVEDQKKLQDFRKEFEKQTNELKKWMVVVNHMFHDKFIIENLNQILLKSDDPRDIAHIAFPIAAIFRGISRAYLSLKSKKHDPVYIVAVLDKDEMDLITSMKDKNCCFAFPIFMRGFTGEDKARKQLKKVKEQYKNQKTAVLFTVNFPSHDKLDPLNDYGFYINPDSSTKDEGDVVFNILNTFKMVATFSKTEYDLEYGHLSALYHNNKAERIKGQDAGAIRVYDICEAVSQHYLKSQSCLFRIINEPEESLHFSRSVISHSKAPTQPNAPPATEIEIQNMINNYIDDNKYEKALQLIASSNQSNLMKAKKLEILYKQGKLKEAEEMITKIVPDYKPINQATEIRDFIEAKLTIKQGSAQSKNLALKKLRLLAERMSAKYKSSFQVIGTEVITAIEQLVGTGKDKDEKALFESQAETKAALQTTAINLRGISTTI